MIEKVNMKNNKGTQLLEDVAYLVFLVYQLEDFDREHDKKKVIKILQKNWAKMPEHWHDLALEI